MSNDQINELVAERVMGWQVFDGGGYAVGSRPYPHVFRSSRFGVGLIWLCESEAEATRPWMPATDIANAWRVVEQLRTRDILIDVLTMVDGYVVNAKGVPRSGLDWMLAQVPADAAPMGICLAALEALGVPVPADCGAG